MPSKRVVEADKALRDNPAPNPRRDAVIEALMPAWLEELAPILILLTVIALVVWRLPHVDLGHSKEFRRRRFMNWFPLGMTYAFLYMGRYNLTVATSSLGELITNADFGTIKMVGTWVYGLSFLINGPLTDRIGGRKTMLIAALGAAFANAAMGVLVLSGARDNLVPQLGFLYALNMYFQSFGAVSIVKVNAAWFHLRERGTFGGIFGILISLGIYFAFDWSALILEHAETHWVFFVPAILLIVFFVASFIWVRDTPSEAGFPDIETGDATLHDPKKSDTYREHNPSAQHVHKGGVKETIRSIGYVGGLMLRNPVILIIAAIEFCSGFLRSGLMDGYGLFSRQTHIDNFLSHNWGMVQCCAGILGGIIAGLISDRVFHSRRGPVASILYGVMIVGSLVMWLTMDNSLAVSATVSVMTLSIIGVHGMLSGAASMDFGGKQNVGIVVGIIDGLVYLGQGAQYLCFSRLAPSAEAQAVTSNWSFLPLMYLPIAILGVVLASRIWNAKPSAGGAH